ncbi:MAG TPA: glutaredoxin family protein [Thermoanaerobaculia bacterium]|nr:glutaredoxin family protein [Thermoanaerobaculia bacterium]
MSRSSGARYELLSREGCHLCDDMARLLDDVLPVRGLTYAVVDIDCDPGLRARWGEAVPVLLRDGAPVAKVRLDRARLERILAKRR